MISLILLQPCSASISRVSRSNSRRFVSLLRSKPHFEVLWFCDNVMINCFRGSEDPNSGDPLVALRAFQMAQSKQFRKPVCFPTSHYHHIPQQLLGSQLSSLHRSHLKMKPFSYFPLSLAQVQSSTESLGSALKMIKKRRSLFEHGDYHD